MTNPVGLNITLRYEPMTERSNDHLPAQPVRVTLKGNTRMTKLIPISPMLIGNTCIGCVADDTRGPGTSLVDCFKLPKCDGAIYVRVNQENLMRHIEWRLENDK